ELPVQRDAGVLQRELLRQELAPARPLPGRGVLDRARHGRRHGLLVVGHGPDATDPGPRGALVGRRAGRGPGREGCQAGTMSPAVWVLARWRRASASDQLTRFHQAVT